jgi:hypothetical protein
MSWTSACFLRLEGECRCVLTATQTAGYATENAEAGSGNWFDEHQRALVERINQA